MVLETILERFITEHIETKIKGESELSFEPKFSTRITVSKAQIQRFLKILGK